MAWETRAGTENRYYCRTTKRHGRVIREYLGRGPAAEAAAALDGLRRQAREQERAERQAQQTLWQDGTTPVAALCTAADELMESALLAHGFHRPFRCAWRKRMPHLVAGDESSPPSKGLDA